MLNKSKFHMKTLYAKLRDDEQDVARRTLLYNNVTRPRVMMNLWHAFHGKLVTREKLHKFGMVGNTRCYFYDKEETVNHLFFGRVELKRIFGARFLIGSKSFTSTRNGMKKCIRF